MNCTSSPSSPSLPHTSDLVYDDWEDQLNLIVIPSSTNSDDFEALHLLQKESTAEKNKQRLVIQHRAWQLGDVFQSEEDYIDGRSYKLFFRKLLTCPSDTLTISTDAQ